MRTVSDVPSHRRRRHVQWQLKASLRFAHCVPSPKHRRTLEFPSTFRKSFLLHLTNPSRTFIIVTCAPRLHVFVIPTRSHPTSAPIAAPGLHPCYSSRCSSPATVRRSLRSEHVPRTQTTTRRTRITHQRSPNTLAKPPRPLKRGTMVTSHIDSSFYVLPGLFIYSWSRYWYLNKLSCVRGCEYTARSFCIPFHSHITSRILLNSMQH